MAHEHQPLIGIAQPKLEKVTWSANRRHIPLYHALLQDGDLLHENLVFVLHR
jgi:hypothetical protein